MSVHSRKRLVPVALSLLVLFSAGFAQTATAKAAKKVSSASVKFIDGPSSETAAAREKRLRRECRGRVNAGACLGHTR